MNAPNSLESISLKIKDSTFFSMSDPDKEILNSYWSHAYSKDLDSLESFKCYIDWGHMILNKVFPNSKVTNKEKSLSLNYSGSYIARELKGQLQVTINLSVRPSAKVEIKTKSGVQLDESDYNGELSKKISVNPGEDYVYLKVSEDSINEYKKLDIYTNEMVDVDENEYTSYK